MSAPTQQPVYEVVDTHTREVVGTYATRRKAFNRATKLDLAYGAYRYVVRRAMQAPATLADAQRTVDQYFRLPK